eukprot:61847-Pyramimonas_sp.AAC.1
MSKSSSQTMITAQASSFGCFGCLETSVKKVDPCVRLQWSRWMVAQHVFGGHVKALVVAVE